MNTTTIIIDPPVAAIDAANLAGPLFVGADRHDMPDWPTADEIEDALLADLAGLDHYERWGLVQDLDEAGLDDGAAAMHCLAERLDADEREQLARRGERS